MKKLSIAIEISSIDELHALTDALALFIDMEGERVKEASEFKSKREQLEATAKVEAARDLYRSIKEGK